MSIQTTKKTKSFLLLLLLCVPLLVGLVPTQKSSAFVGGDGLAEETAFQISNCAEWLNMSSNLDAFYILVANIDCSGVSYTPIGDSVTPFIGQLNGDGYTINNVTYTANQLNGLFGSVENATIKNLHIKDATFTSTTNGTGAVAGVATDSAFNDIIVENVNIVTGNSGVAGGMLGRANGTVTINRSKAKVNIALTSGTTGGLVGLNESNLTVVDSYAEGTINSVVAGGMIGQHSNNTVIIQDSYANIKTTFSGAYATGGFVAQMPFAGASLTLTSSFSASDFTATTGTNIGGIVGLIDPGAGNTFTDAYFDQTRAATANCDQDLVTTCNAVTNSDYFRGNGTNAPMNIWSTVWNLNEPSQYPTFNIGSAACDDPVDQMESAVYMTCEFQRNTKHRYTGNVVEYALRYRKAGTNDQWVTVPITNKDYIKVVLTGLTPNTLYSIALHAKWERGSSDWLENTALLATTTTASDSDGDGISDSEEIGAPNLGNASNDPELIGNYTTDDRLQANVTSFRNNLTGKYTLLQTNCTGNSAVSIMPEPASSSDSAFAYSAGLMSFTATGCGSVATITQYYFGAYDSTKLVARKYNPTTKTYVTIDGAVLSSVEIGGQSALKIVYTVSDNGPLDTNPAVGTITDPAGPASTVSGTTISSPNTGLERQNLVAAYGLITIGALGMFFSWYLRISRATQQQERSSL